MNQLTWISVLGVIGVLTRYGVGLLMNRMTPLPFLLSTWSINLSGAFLIGIVYVCAQERILISDEIRAGIMIGFLGGYTTFSSYCLESLRLFEEGRMVWCLLYWASSPILGVMATGLGMSLARRFL